MIEEFIKFLVCMYGKAAYSYVPNMTDVEMFTKIYKTTPEEISELHRFVKECLQNAKLGEIETDFE